MVFQCKNYSEITVETRTQLKSVIFTTDIFAVSFSPKKIQIPCTDQKVPFWQFFRQGRDGRALLVRPSRIPHRISKILFALGADEFLAMLEGKIREAPFF